MSYTTDEKKIWQDRVVLVVMTRLTERVMRPTFGSTVGDSVFESEETAESMIQQAVAAGFSQWLKPLTLTKVTITVDPADGYLLATVQYRYEKETNDQSVQIKTAILNQFERMDQKAL
ncbi:MAG: GPW/gp25 family protein, partial [Paludibacter sp.]